MFSISPTVMLVLAIVNFIGAIAFLKLALDSRKLAVDGWKSTGAFSLALLALAVAYLDGYSSRVEREQAHPTPIVVETNATYINTGIKTEANASEVGFRATIALTTQNYGDFPMKTENGVLYISKEFAKSVDKATLEKAVRKYETSGADEAKNLKSYEVQK